MCHINANAPETMHLKSCLETCYSFPGQRSAEETSTNSLPFETPLDAVSSYLPCSSCFLQSLLKHGSAFIARTLFTWLRCGTGCHEALSQTVSAAPSTAHSLHHAQGTTTQTTILVTKGIGNQWRGVFYFFKER